MLIQMYIPLQANTHCTKFQYISSFVQYTKHIVSYHSVSKALYTATLYTETVHVRLPTVYMMNNDKNTDV